MSGSYLTLAVETYSTDEVTNNLDEGGIENLINARPKMIVIYHALKHMRYALENLDGLVVGREYAMEKQIEDMGLQPGVETAQIQFELLHDLALNRPHPLGGVTWLVYPNEPTVDIRRDDDSLDVEATKKQRAGLNAHWVKLIKLCYAAGMKIAVGNFSAESNLFDKIDDFREMLEMAAIYNMPLALHGYGSPRLDDPDVEQFVFPYRKLRDEAARKGIRLPKIIVTEFGIDSLYSLGRVYPGWKTVTDAEGFAVQLAWAGDQLALDGVPAAVFIYTRNSGDEAKTNYNVAFATNTKRGTPVCADLIMEYIANYHGEIVEPPPPPPPPPPDNPPDEPPSNNFASFKLPVMIEAVAPGSIKVREV